MAGRTSTKRRKLYRVVACPNGHLQVARYEHFRCCGRQYLTANHTVEKFAAAHSGAAPAAAREPTPEPSSAVQDQPTEHPQLEFEW